MKNRFLQKNLLAFFLLPSIAGCLIFIFLPSIGSFMLSFCDWNLINKIKFAGVDNYINLLKIQ